VPGAGLNFISYKKKDVLSVVSNDFEVLPRRRSQDIDKLIREHNEEHLNQYLDNLQRQLTEEDEAQKDMQEVYYSQVQVKMKGRYPDEPDSVILGQVSGCQQEVEGESAEYSGRGGGEQHQSETKSYAATETDA
jgi:hypothetical protein